MPSPNQPPPTSGSHLARPAGALLPALLLPLALLLPAPWAAAAVALAGTAWLLPARRGAGESRRRRLAAGALLALAVAVLVAPWLIGRAMSGEYAAGEAPPEWLRAGYAELWRELAEEASSAAAALGEPPADEAARRGAFDELVARARGGPRGLTLILLDPDGEAVAWAGEGLIHEPAAGATPGARGYSASFGAATLYASVALTAATPSGDPGEEREPRAWQVVAGRSLPTDQWPVEPPFWIDDRVRWSLAGAGVEPLPEALLVPAAGAPDLVVDARPVPALESLTADARRIAAFLVAILLAASGVVYGLAALLPVRPSPAAVVRRRRVEAILLAGGAAGAAVLAGGATGEHVLLVYGGLAAAAGAAASLGGRPGVRLRSRRGRAAAAAAGTLALAGAAWLLQLYWGPVDVAAGLGPPASAVAIRLAFAAAAAALLVACRGRTAPAGDRLAWAAVALLFTAGAIHDLPAIGLPFAALGAAAAADWLSGRPLRRLTTLALLLLMASLLGAVVWESAHRPGLERSIETRFLAAMAPPTPTELVALEERVAASLAGLDLATLAPRDPAGLGDRDLAFSLWQRSGLARRNMLSALAVEPLGETSGDEPAEFSFGLSYAEGGAWGVEDRAPLPVWSAAEVDGSVLLEFAGRPWARARYRFVPRPGYRLVGGIDFDAVEIGLIRSRSEPEAIAGLPPSVLYGLFAPDGRALVSPWLEAPPLPPRLTERDRALTATPIGIAWAWARTGADGREVLFLPILPPLPALERVGTHAAANLLLVAGAVLLLVLLALPRAVFRRAVGDTLRSYSRRLIIVFSLLLLLPLLLLDLVILSAAEERLRREQRTAGEAALASARRVIGDYVDTLEPGFGFDTLVDDELLRWLSRVIQHEVNLYWGGTVYASSKPELFTAGLLSERIPGEIFARLALGGYEAAARTNRAGDTEYLELYAPLRLPGSPATEQRLFLSMPLLTEQAEVALEMAALRRQAVIVSTGLFALLVAVGVALARRFSGPIEELVEGTRRIAGGARSLGLAPRELELAALVSAIDEMAGRIATSRERLVREKQVVEQVVESVTAGVVSVDRDGRVLLHNRSAEQLLGVEVGESLAARLAAAPALAPVARFVGEAGDRLERATVRLPGGGDDGATGENEWSLVWVPVPGAGEPAALLVVEDVTEVLRGQRLEAWAEMARIIAHEIKNPLTPIRLSAEHMREVHRADPAAFADVFERCTRNILRHVDELRQIASEFSAYSALPGIEPRSLDLVAAMRELVDGYAAAEAARGVRVRLDPERPSIDARFDPRLLGRAVRNLLENALRATVAAGGDEVVVRVTTTDHLATVAVLDRGPGVEPDLLPRIFDPYFSTHDHGTGLGLPVARRIAEDHGGGIVAHNLPDGGLEVALTIPLP